MLEIVKYPHPALRYVSRPIQEIDEGLRSTVRRMFELMYEARGIGLAATQVALPFQFFVLNLTADPNRPDQEQVFINPEIIKRHALVEGEEGCLSLPGFYYEVRRARRIRVRAYDLEGNLFEQDVGDLFSRAVQHETDHLDGKLFIDYLDTTDLPEIEDKLWEMDLRFRQGQRSGLIPPDDELKRRLDEMLRVPPVPPEEFGMRTRRDEPEPEAEGPVD